MKRALICVPVSTITRALLCDDSTAPGTASDVAEPDGSIDDATRMTVSAAAMRVSGDLRITSLTPSRASQRPLRGS